MDYTRLTLREIESALSALVRDTEATFGRLDARQLNWRPDVQQWSVAQCFDHLFTANRLMFDAAENALTGATPPTIWQRLPMLPGLFGRALIRSQAPQSTRKYKAPLKAQPSVSNVAPDVLERFVDQQREAARAVLALDQLRAARVIMTSPFVRVITYSVLDGWRLVVAHNHRHIQQATRVLAARAFPA
jgi:hypothetical protein